MRLSFTMALLPRILQQRLSYAASQWHASARPGARCMSAERTPAAYASVIPTMHFQRSLPRLPIPTLEDTARKYLYFAEPVLTPEQFRATKAAVDAFTAPSGPGPRLHAHLMSWDAANKGTSYISAMWYDMYLSNRDALPLNLNPQLTWRDDAVASKNEQCVKAANVTAAAVRFFLALRGGVLEPDVFHTKPETSKGALFSRIVSLVPQSFSWYAMYLAGGYALDMSQYPRLFESTRIPKLGMDELVTASTSSAGAKHIVVQRGERFYRVEVVNSAGAPLPASGIEAALRWILHDSAPSAGAPHVGACTGAPRDEWAAMRAKLERSPVNAATLACIDSSLFVLTLDDASPAGHEALSRAMLHGNARNRWFDKCFNLIVCANGKAGINWEHAWGDGAAVLYFFNNVYRDICDAPAREMTQAAATLAAPLQWDLSDAGVVEGIRAAELYSDGVIGDTDLRVYQSESMTKEDVKRSALSPDGVMQMLLQVAHARAHGYTPSTYESASTAGFKHGRTEVIRSATPEAVAMVKHFLDASKGHGDGLIARYEALSAATGKHRKITVDALMGKGVDRHLFALHKWSERLNIAPTPSIFTDPGYAIFKDIRLSTSTLASPALEGGGFGPVSRTSYGVGYGIEERGAHFHIMNYKKQTTNSEVFAGALEFALKEFRECISAAKAAGKISKQQ